MRVLVDTCVIIDALQDRRQAYLEPLMPYDGKYLPFSEKAQIIFYAVANKQIDGYISAKAITDIYYLTHRLTHSDESTRQILKTLLGLFDILDTTAIDCRKALSSDIADYEDAVMSETAERCGVDCIVTRNRKDYIKSKTKVFTPEELIQLLEESEEN